MSEFEQVHEVAPQSTRSRQRNEEGETEFSVLYAQHGRVPDGFTNLYTRRNLDAAPALSERFDETGQEIYGGLDPKTVFFPPDKQAQYGQDNPKAPAEEIKQVADALNDHGIRSLQLARRLFGMPNVIWLGLVSKDGQVLIEGSEAANKELVKTEDELGWFMRSPASDIGVVAPKQDGDEKLTLAMGVADCLAIPVVDTRTHAFAFAHAGRPGTGLRTAEAAAFSLIEHYGSKAEDLIAFLGEGVCMDCYLISETALNGFIDDFGGKAEIAKVVSQYPSAMKEVERPEGKRYAVDLYAFNKYLLARQKIGEILVAPNCTARSSLDCMTLAGKPVPKEQAQQYFSHERAKNNTVGWAMASGETMQLPTYLLTTPRNLAIVTRF